MDSSSGEAIELANDLMETKENQYLENKSQQKNKKSSKSKKDPINKGGNKKK